MDPIENGDIPASYVSLPEGYIKIIVLDLRLFDAKGKSDDQKYDPIDGGLFDGDESHGMGSNP